MAADQPFQIKFVNQDPLPHNVAIHQGSPSGPAVFTGEIVTGPTEITYDVPPLPAGAYAAMLSPPEHDRHAERRVRSTDGDSCARARRRGYRTGLYEWLTTTDHKKIGILYLINSFIFFFLAGLLALGVRVELAQPGLQFVTDQTYNELFTMHATAMIFLFIIPILAGFANYIVPLQIGAPDMAFPRINALSFWMLPSGSCSSSGS